MKVDLPLAVRNCTDEDNQREIRLALVRRHFAVLREHLKIGASLFHNALSFGARAITVPTNGAAPVVAGLLAPSATILRSAIELA